MNDSKPLVFRFGEFEISEHEHRLLRGGEEMHLQPRTFRLLLYLVRHRDRVVGKDEILREIWNDAEVTDNSLARSISTLRKVLNDDPREQRAIRTISAVGYRFVFPIDTLEDPCGQEPEVPALALRLEEGGPSAPAAVPGGHRRLGALAAAALAVFLVAGAVWRWHWQSRVRWARSVTMPEIVRLEEQGRYPAAAELVSRARLVIGNDPALDKLWVRATGEVSIATQPSGALVEIRPYTGDPNAWIRLGSTPIVKAWIPRQPYVWRITRPGFAPISFLGRPPETLLVGDVWTFERTLKLWPASSVPPEMAPVGGDSVALDYPLERAPEVKVDDFLIDRHEVTNSDYKRFVDAGCYSRPQFWKEPFLLDGRTLDWMQAVSRFRDSTGRPGPSTWEAGSYPPGHAAHPVAGVNWYEAVAYAVFAGKTLPTGYHWTLAAQASEGVSMIAAGSNFKSVATVPVGSSSALSGWGTTDMAGNVKEWCTNETGDGKRLILGGGFGEPEYTFEQTDAQSPWERRANFGFRLMKLTSPASPESMARVVSMHRDYRGEKPVSDSVFATLATAYAYDHTDLNPRIEETSELPGWRREKVTIAAAYGGERMAIHLFLPRAARPPYQSVVFMPSAMAAFEDQLDLDSVEAANEFLLNSDRAIAVPTYKGMYERRDGYNPGNSPPARRRDHIIAWYKDVARTLDYLATRRDLDSQRIAYMGYSLGAGQAPVQLAMEKRFHAAVLISGGFQLRTYLPEVDPLNFACRVHTPVLMINGRYDADFPVETSQNPMFDFFGTAPADKKHVIFEANHGAFPRPEAVRLTLDWLDRYLGTVAK